MHCAPNSSPSTTKRFPVMSTAESRAATGRSSIPYRPRTERQPSDVSSTSSLTHSIFGSITTSPASSTSMIATRSGTPICGAAMPMPRATTIEANIRLASVSSSVRERRGFFAGTWSTGSPIWRTSTAFFAMNSGVEHFERILAAQDELNAERARAFRGEGRRGPEHVSIGACRRAQCRRVRLGALGHGVGALRLRLKEYEPPERRIAESRAPRELCLRERRVIVRRGGADRVVIRQIRLQHAAPTRAPATRATEHLRQKLERPLGRCVVGEVEHRVGVHHADERHAGEVEPLRDHLRADDHLRVPGAHALEESGVRALRAHGVAVVAQQGRAGHGLADFLEHALGPDAEMSDALAPAVRADRRRLSAPPATVAHERAVEVIGERDVAFGAVHDETAVAAEHDRREAAPVQIEDGLLALGHGALEGELERARERATVAGLQLEPQVDDRRLR